MLTFSDKQLVPIFYLFVTQVNLRMQSLELVEDNCPSNVTFATSVSESLAKPSQRDV